MLEQQDPSIIQQKIAIENFTQQFIANDEGGDRAVLTIPVVVHVVWNTATENISEAQILSQLDVLNEDFRKMNADVSSVPGVFQPLASDVEIEFCLATTDPNGNPTSGITRTNTSLTSFPYPGNAMKFDAQGGKDAWPRDSYLNMWVCDLAAGLLGFAQFPGGGASTDGVVIDYLYFGNTGTATAPYDLGRTATHEVGHWLNLYHIWGDDDDCSGSDLVADTPNQEVDNGGCPTFPHVTCSNGPNGDMFMNYMDYTNDACMFMFSAGQTTRMRALFASGGFREPLLSSMGCGIPPACSAPTGLAASGITQTGATVSWGTVAEATNGYQYVVSTSSSTPSGSGTATASISVSAGTLTANTSYYLFVRTNCGIDGFSAWSGPYAFSTPCAAVNSFPFNETFESASTSRPCWKVNEYVSGASIDWTYGTGAAGGGSITAAHGGTVNARFYKADNSSPSLTRLVSPPLNISSLTSPEVSFWYANEAWSGDQDELRVFYKTSSGGTWTQISGATYTTSVSSWTEVVLSLPSGSSDYYISFQGTARYGRGLVVDDVQVRNGNTCSAPAGLTATAASSTTANIGWGTVAGASGGYEYVVSNSNAAPSGSGTPFAGTSTTVGSLTAGTTYYLFVRSNCGSGNFSSWAGPQSFTTPIANDNCSEAIVLTPSLSCNTVSGTTVGATQSIPAITCATFTGNANDDVWYSFTAISPNHTITVDGDTGFDAVVDVRSGSCNGTNMACADATSGGGIEQVVLSGLSNNTIYYIRIYGYGSAASNGGFTVCVTMPAAVTWYLDFDGDGRYVSTQQAYFSPGTGWTTTAGISGDCNDNNILVWQSASLYIDNDSDGYNAGTQTVCYGASIPAGYSTTTSGTDCNDNNNAIRPNATEVCDGVDNNCNGSTDEGVTTTYYLDSDNDGYGSNASTTQACSLPVGYAIVGGDCNNSNSAIHPGASELCNGIDDDCDSQIDEGVLITFYRDQDNDGYGDDSNTTSACSAPGGFVAIGGDCNDNNSSIYPNAPEVCDGLDNDCDSSTDEGLVFTNYYADLDSDGYGSGLLGSFCAAPANSSVNNLDCNDGNNSIHPGAIELCNGIDDDCDGSTDEDIVSQNYYSDNDGDGFGSTTLLGSFCSPPANSSLNNTDCNDADNSVWQSALLYVDSDNDGYNAGTQTICYGASLPTGYSMSTLGTDCNDNNNAINPGASEICDGIDNNCDGSTDEGLIQTYYFDNDGDGFGNNSVSVQACSPPLGYVIAGGDCNDTNDAIYPGANELCNGLDDDCNGNADDGLTFNNYYADNDGDGYGSSTLLGSFCNAPANSSLNNLDCNDSSTSINPGATELCNGIDDDCDGNTDEDIVSQNYYADNDGDGYGSSTLLGSFCIAPANSSLNNLDCNDNNASIRPGAAEVCDGIDNDCDGSIDEGMMNTFYFDNDGDGYGNNSVTVQACSAPVGYVSLGGDCHDNNNAIHPGATELCDGVDNNCNGSTDEGVTTTYYLDTDNDGYGSSASTTQACSLPVGYAAVGGDCNNNNNAIHPGATEACDGIDNNCNSSTDEGVTATYYLDSDGDGYGSNTSTTQACSLPVGYATIGGDCNDGNSAIHPNAAEQCNGINDDCDGQTDEGCGVTADPPANDNFALNNPSVSAVSYVYPNCISIQGTTAGATISPYTGNREVWYQFIAQSNGVSIAVNSSIINSKIYLFSSNNPNVAIDEEDINSGGSEVLNYGNLIAGQSYHIAIASVGATDGAFSFCIKQLRRPGCTQPPSGGYTLCSLFKSSATGAANTTFSFTNSQNQITSITSAGPIALSQPSLQLAYGETFTANLVANYLLFDGLGNEEIISVANAAPCSVYINSHPAVDVKSNLRCVNGATLYRASYLLAASSAGSGICGVTGYTVEFTPVSNCNGNNPQGLETFTKTVASPTACISLSYAFNQIPLSANPGLGYWSVRWKPRFGNIEGEYGNSHVIAVNGTAPINMMPDPASGQNSLSNLNESLAPNANIYPNPNSGDQMNLQITGGETDEVFVGVIDGLGKRIYSNRFTTIESLSTAIVFDQPLPTGLYLVEIVVGTETIRKRMIIAR